MGKERMAQKRQEREEAQMKKKKERQSKPKGGLMDGAFATIRGGGMKTFRAKRGSPMMESLEEFAAQMERGMSESEPVVEDVLLANSTQNTPEVNFDSPVVPEVAPASPVIESEIPSFEEFDSADCLEDLLADGSL